MFRKFQSFSILYFVILISTQARAVPKMCDVMQSTFDQSIKAQIEKGIPFDLVILMKTSSEETCQTIVSIKYNLWQENLTFRKGSQTSKPLTLGVARTTLCQWINCLEPKNERETRIAKLKVLLNPLWEGQSKAMIRTKQNSVIRFFRFEWNDLAKDLPKELEVINEEVVL